MGKSRDWFMEMMEMIELMKEKLNVDDIHPFKEKERYTEETFEIIKGKFKSIFNVKFDGDGKARGINYEAIYIPTKEEEKENQVLLLQRDMEAAVEEQDFLKAAEIKKQVEQVMQTNI